MGIFDSLKSFGSNAMDFGKGLLKEDEYGQSKLGLFGDKLLDINDGGDRYAGDMNHKAGLVATEKQKAFKDSLIAKAKALGFSDQDLFALEADPSSFAKAYGERVNRAPQVVGGGDSVYENGAFKTAPMLGVSEGRGYNLTPQGLDQIGTLSPSFQEQTARQKAEEDAAQAKAALEELMRNNREKNQISRGQLGVAQGALNLRRQGQGFGGGSGGHPPLPPGFEIE